MGDSRSLVHRMEHESWRTEWVWVTVLLTPLFIDRREIYRPSLEFQAYPVDLYWSVWAAILYLSMAGWLK